MARSDRSCVFCAWVLGTAIGTALLVDLAGCTTPTVTTCPPIVAYTPAAMTQAGTELSALPDGSQLAAMMGDYKRERAELRACVGQQ